MFQNKLC